MCWRVVRHVGSFSDRASPPKGAAAKPCGPSGAPHVGGGGGFALHEAVRGRVVGVSDPHVVQIPPFGDGEAPT